jgi:hypothetical protein
MLAPASPLPLYSALEVSEAILALSACLALISTIRISRLGSEATASSTFSDPSFTLRHSEKNLILLPGSSIRRKYWMKNLVAVGKWEWGSGGKRVRTLEYSELM